jgi:hypothetical protein
MDLYANVCYYDCQSRVTGSISAHVLFPLRKTMPHTRGSGRVYLDLTYIARKFIRFSFFRGEIIIHIAVLKIFLMIYNEALIIGQTCIITYAKCI